VCHIRVHSLCPNRNPLTELSLTVYSIVFRKVHPDNRSVDILVLVHPLISKQVANLDFLYWVE